MASASCKASTAAARSERVRPLAALRGRWKVALRARDQSRQPVDAVAVAEDRVALEDPGDECQVFLRLRDEPELDDRERGQPQAPRPAGADASRVPGGGLEPAFVRALEVAGEPLRLGPVGKQHLVPVIPGGPTALLDEALPIVEA